MVWFRKEPTNYNVNALEGVNHQIFRRNAHFFPYFSKSMGDHNEFGRLGEEVAEDFLIKKGYKILRKNFYYAKAEVDIIAQKGEILAIVEVKSRSQHFVKDLKEVIHPKKIKLLVKATDYFVQENNLDVEVRFDVITVIKTKLGFSVEHLEDAFHYF